MCLILLGVDNCPSYSILKKAWDANNHGAGLIWMNKDNKAQYIKGIDSLQELSDLVDKTELPFVIHFRIASVGGVNPLLTQPFEITEKSELRLEGEADRVLVHNGTEPDWKKCLAAAGFRLPRDKDGKEEPISDSRAIAMILSRHKNNDFLHIASGGRFVVIGHNNKADENAFRFFGDFTEEDGIFYSNSSWKWGKTFTGLQGESFYDRHYAPVAQSLAPVATTHSASSAGCGMELVKKKDENLFSDDIPPLKSFKLYTNVEKLVYRRWWRIKNYEGRLGVEIPNENKTIQIEQAENGELMIAHMF